MAGPEQQSMNEEGEALLEWVNTFPLREPVRHLTELNDGHTLWIILREIDDSSFTGTLPNDAEDSVGRLKNVQSVYSRMQERLQANGQDFERLTEQNLHDIAAGIADSDIMQLLRMAMLVMVSSPNIATFLGRIQDLPGSSPQILGECMRKMLKWTSVDSQDGSNLPIPAEFAHGDRGVEDASPLPDPRREIFVLEEQVAKTVAQLERRNRDFELLEGEHHILGENFARLQETNGALAAQVTDRDEQLKKLNAVHGQREQSTVKELEFKISHQEELIGALEADLSKVRNASLDLQRENQKLVFTDDKLQKLQDEHDATKSELERQSRKANTVEKYMQKVQGAQLMEKDRDRLKQDLEEARKQLSSTSSLRLENLALQKTNSEVSRTLAQIEREYEEMRITNKQLRMQRDELFRRNEDLEERANQDGIAGMRENRVDTLSSRSPTDENVLENELAESSMRDGNMKQQISALLNENQQNASELSELKAALVAADMARKDNIDDSPQTQRREQEKAKLQNDLEKSSMEITELKEKLRSRSEHAGEDLHVRQTSKSVGGPPDTETLNGGKLQGILPTTQSFTRQELDQLLDGRSCTDDKADILDIVMEKLDAARSQTIEQHQQYELAKQRSEGLESQIEKLKRESGGLPISDDDKCYIRNVDRENRLISSAFHDLAGRLLLNSTSLQRKADNQRSWLGRQRRSLEVPIGMTR